MVVFIYKWFTKQSLVRRQAKLRFVDFLHKSKFFERYGLKKKGQNHVVDKLCLSTTWFCTQVLAFTRCKADYKTMFCQACLTRKT